MQLAQIVIKQSKRLFSNMNHRLRTQHWIPNPIKEMIEDDQNKTEAMANCFEAVFTKESLPDEGLDPNTKSTNRLPTVNFNRDEILKSYGTLDTENLIEPD